ncbi:FtsX-like permease family protein [bacterium]|nr:FtsX-like permease family protein [bacterium]
MVPHLLRHTFRRFRLRKVETLVHLFGLTLGLTGCVLITLYVLDETRYDRFHLDADRIVRVSFDWRMDDGGYMEDCTTPPAVAWKLRNEFPEAEAVTAFMPDWGMNVSLKAGEERLFEQAPFRVDSSFFDVFDFPVLHGDPAVALRDPESIVLTAHLARRLFGRTDIIGETVLVGSKTRKIELVLDDIPQRSHFRFSMLRPHHVEQAASNWEQWNWYTYVRLAEGTEPAEFEARFNDAMMKIYREQDTAFDLATPPSIARVHRITDIHLHSHRRWELGANSDIAYIWIFSSIALILLLTAGFNYLNLSTAQALQRSLEAGVRRTIGAGRVNLIVQQLVEAAVLVGAAVLLSTALVEMLLPLFEQVSGKVFDSPGSRPFWLWPAAAFAALCIGMLSAVYPGLVLARIRPVRALKGEKPAARSGFTLRRALVLLQFVLTIGVVAATLLVNRQVTYISRTGLGFDKEQLVNVKLRNKEAQNAYSVLKEKLSERPIVLGVSSAGGVVGRQNWTTRFGFEGREDRLFANFLMVDHDFPDVMGFSRTAGDPFDVREDTTQLQLMVNETAAKMIGDEVVGRTGTTFEMNTVVIGIVKDFHFRSLHHEIAPFILVHHNMERSEMVVRFDASRTEAAMTDLQEIWREVLPSHPLETEFLDRTFAELHANEARMRTVLLLFSIPALLVASLGLFGLVHHASTRRLKEIGIRKVLGASTIGLFGLLSREFLLLVAGANLAALPLAWWAMHRWLEGFAYHVDIGAPDFALAGLGVLLVALVTTALQAIRAIRVNPSDLLRNE